MNECAPAEEISIDIDNVPSEHLETFDQKLSAFFEHVAAEGMDMKRMSMVLCSNERRVGADVLFRVLNHT